MPSADQFYENTYKNITKVSTSNKNVSLPGRITLEDFKKIEFISLDAFRNDKLNDSQLLGLKLLETADSDAQNDQSTEMATKKLEKSQVINIKESEEEHPLNRHLASLLLEDEDSFRDGVTHEELSHVLYVNAKLGNTKNSEKVFELMKKNDIKPVIDDYNSLMNSYANSGDLKSLLRTFNNLMENSRTNAENTPNTKSYGIVIKCLVHYKRLTDAFNLYTFMKEQGIPLSQPIFTTLLKGCTKSGDLNRAFRLFDYMKISQFRPDSISYTHMIHACAKHGWTEKAFSLFEEMMSSVDEEGVPLVPIDSTFNALIHACAKRPDYYNTCFELVEQMKSAGHKIGPLTYEYLLMASAYQADIWRAKLLCDEMEKSGIEISTRSCNWILSCYAKVPTLMRQLKSETVGRRKRLEWEKTYIEAKMGLDNEKRMNEGNRPIDINDWIVDEEFNPNAKFSWSLADPDLDTLRDYILRGKTESEFLQDLYDDGKNFFGNILRISDKSSADADSDKTIPSIPINENMTINKYSINNYISFLGEMGKKKEAYDAYKNLFSLINEKPDSTTYLRLISSLVKPHFNYDTEDCSLGPIARSTEEAEFVFSKIWEIYREYEKYRRAESLPDRWEDIEKKFRRNKWIQRGITHEDRRKEYYIFVHMINGLTKFDDLDNALKLLNLLVERGHAEVTNLMHLNPDGYSPLLSSITPSKLQPNPRNKLHISHPKHKVLDDAVLDRPSYPEVDSSLFINENNQTELGEKISNIMGLVSSKNHSKPSALLSGDQNPMFLTKQLVQFNPSHFKVLSRRAYELNRKDLAQRVSTILKDAEKKVEYRENTAKKLTNQAKQALKRRSRNFA